MQQEFKSSFKTYFPVVYDTKYILNNSNILANEVHPWTDLASSFQNLLKYKDNDPKIELDENFTEYKLGSHMLKEEEFLSHEAGFDRIYFL